MEEKLDISKNRRKSDALPPRRRGKHHTKGRRYPVELKLHAVKLHTEEGYSESEITEALGVANATLYRWLDRYKKEGEAGLRPRDFKGGKPKKAAVVKAKTVEIKKRNPGFGVKRISQLLRRWFHLPASAETVRKTLHEEELVEKPRKKAKANPRKPRFFERARPNQMWQSDLLTFRLGGRDAYLVAFLDDHSR